MPNPKVGTVTFEVGKAVKESKAGKVEFRVEKAGIVHAPVGKVSFDVDKLKGNVLALVEALVKAKPSAAKGVYIKKISMSSSMGPGINLDISDVTSQL
jgi:large subunit ribosomal protein L1